MKLDPESLFQATRSIGLQPVEFNEIRENIQMSVTKEGEVRLGGTMDQENFLTSAQRLALGTDEKAQIRAAILEGIASSSLSTSPFRGLLRICSGSMAAITVFVLCGAGVSYAAESALPGDALYTVKVHFTESILLRLSNSLETKAKLQARLVSRRLEEAEKLAEKSKLTAERVAIVQARLIEHVEALEVDLQELAALDQQTSGSIAIDTAAEMEAHENLLQRIRTDNNPEDVERLLKETRKARHIAEKITVASGIRNLAEVKAKKADDEIRKTKAAKTWKARVNEDTDIANTILTAEIDLKASEEAAAAADIRVEKATSALNKAKEAKFMLLLPSHTKLKLSQPVERKPSSRNTGERDDTHVIVSSLSSSTDSSSRTEESSSVTSFSSAPSSSSTSKTSSATSHSSLSSKTSSSFPASSSSVTIQMSTSASASVSVPSAGGILKKADEVNKKTSPKL